MNLGRAIALGRYAEILDKWLQYFDREQILVIWSEDFKRDPFAVMERVQKFLGLTVIDYRLVRLVSWSVGAGS